LWTDFEKAAYKYIICTYLAHSTQQRSSLQLALLGQWVPSDRTFYRYQKPVLAAISRIAEEEVAKSLKSLAPIQLMAMLDGTWSQRRNALRATAIILDSKNRVIAFHHALNRSGNVPIETTVCLLN
jgi:hypothetical protein